MNMEGFPVEDLTATFESRAAASRAISRLLAEGIPQASIHLVENYGDDADGPGDADKGFMEWMSEFFFSSSETDEGPDHRSYALWVTRVTPFQHEKARAVLQRDLATAVG